VNVNGSHVSGLNSEGVIAISTANREITPEDRLRVEEAATIVSLPPNREIVQFFAKNYSLDGQKNIKDPVGMHGVRLEVDAHIVTASSPNLRSLDQALEKAEISATHHTVSGLAAAEAVLTRQQKEAGTALLDIGAGTTNLIVFEDGEVQHVAVIPIGGQHITNDLAIGLRTDLDIAEAVKVQQASLREGARRTTVNVKVGTKTHHFDSEEIAMIAGARVEELLEYVNRELQKIKRAGKLPGGVVVTGGTSKLPGIDDFARDHLELPARIGKLHNIGGLVDTVEDPAYTTVVGLMLLDMLLLPSLPPVHGGGPKAGSKQARALLDGMFRRFKR
jgi:cell division protein FtsA